MDKTGAEASTPGVPLRRGFLVLLDIELFLTLALLVTRVRLADHHDVSIAADDAAVVTDGLDARVDLHCVSLHSLSSYPRDAVERYFPARSLPCGYL